MNTQELLFIRFIIVFKCVCVYIVHREIGNQIVHEKLTGSSLYPGLFDPNENE